MNGYNIFLMIELARCKNLIPIDLEYDTVWAMGSQLYSEFQGSKFDLDTEPEYECILNFLENKK
jgi:hypothetical protein